jgi:hypothetical protein
MFEVLITGIAFELVLSVTASIPRQLTTAEAVPRILEAPEFEGGAMSTSRRYSGQTHCPDDRVIAGRQEHDHGFVEVERAKGDSCLWLRRAGSDTTRALTCRRVPSRP